MVLHKTIYILIHTFSFHCLAIWFLCIGGIHTPQSNTHIIYIPLVILWPNLTHARISNLNIIKETYRIRKSLIEVMEMEATPSPPSQAKPSKKER